MKKLFGGIEAGGTKFFCMVGTGPNNIVDEIRFPTTNPDETIQNAIDFFSPQNQKEKLEAIGIGSFGPLDLNSRSSHYGYITTTPKPNWTNIDILGKIEKALKIPLIIDTDVNAAAYGEYFWNIKHHNLDPLIYITIGTGIGVGVIANNRPIHGLLHPEAGHSAIPHDWEKDPFPGVCPYHGDCLEGLASGPAIAKRWGQKPETLSQEHPAWDLETDYIALAVVNLIYAYSPARIILGGGVANQPNFHNNVRYKVKKFIKGYIQSPMLAEKAEDYIIRPTLGNRSGVLGAIALAVNRDFLSKNANNNE